ncbi:trigger factor [candidate division KSB1 bacterium]|nr:trigger factor [candidate division KSB1 bacterium]NIR73451.1 trigger factor [candidate division KSB1 bacterium]NIS27066.1 trigger factor [candidate division KSB1 bacterium]NIT73910.1 trigger factor [candidate division KSB1 bacterium]NIU27811.1 trigger factor [candidate division KSB1 bacterium]
MKSNITKQGNNQRVIEVDVPDEELSPHFDAAFKKYQKNIRLEGFRKGKVPLSLVKKLYGEEIKNEAIDDVVQSVFKEVSQKENLRPIAPAKLEDVKYEPNEGLQFKAVVEVYPEVELRTYKGVSVEKENYQVGEDDVAAALEDVREGMAVMEPVEEEAQEGHFILADFQQIDVSGVPVIGKKFEDRLFQLGSNSVNFELSDQLIGVKPGETRRIEFRLPTGNPDPEDERKEYYNVEVKEIKSKQLPDLDDELAKDTGKFETLAELKTDIKNQLMKQTEMNSRQKLRHSIIDEVLKKNTIDIPETLVQNYLNAIIESAKKDSNGQVDEEAIKNEYRARAIWNIKWELVKDKIAELENIEVTEEDKKQFISRFAEERGVDEKQFRKTLKNKRGQNRFEDEILEAKVLDLLEKHAKIKQRKVTRKDLEKAKRISMPG